jgi:hypothetical protein
MDDSGKILRQRISQILGQGSQTSTASPSPREDEECESSILRNMKRQMSVLKEESANRKSFDHESLSLRKECEFLKLRIEELNRAHVEDEISRKKEIGELKSNFDEAINRNLDMIDKLLGEKREHCKRIETLIKERDELERKVKLGETRRREEKSERSRWEAKMLEEVKLQNSRALEAETVRLSLMNEEEKRRMESRHLHETRRLTAEWLAKSDAEIERIQTAHSEELLKTIERERHVFLQKEREQFEKHLREIEFERKQAIEWNRSREKDLGAELSKALGIAQVEHENEKQKAITVLKQENLERTRLIERDKADVESRLANTKAEIIVLRDEVHSKEQILKDVNENLQHEQRISADLKQKYEEANAALDEVRFENINLIQRLKIAENNFELMRVTMPDRMDFHRMNKETEETFVHKTFHDLMHKSSINSS